MLDRAVLASRVHRLEDQQHRPAVLRVEPVLEIREHVDTDIAAAHLVISGSNVLLCDGDQLIDVMRQGQGVLNVLAIGGLKMGLDEQLVQLGVAEAGAAAKAV